jgi:hypothetical protein
VSLLAKPSPLNINLAATASQCSTKSGTSPLAAAFSHLDEALCRIFCDLMGDTYNLPLREIYRSVISPNGRVQMLRTLLEKTDLNRLKSNWYDHILADFSDLKAIRNDYLHGLWWTF